MLIFKEISTLLRKEFVLEWRQKYALNGLLLYVISAVFIAYQSFRLATNRLDGVTWNTLFWLILLFAAFNAVAKSFMQERSGRLLYYYSLASPQAVILSKILYNVLLMAVIAVVGLGSYSIFLGNPVQDNVLFFSNLLLGCVGFSGTLTLVSAIASKVHNNATLMAILGFPIILPLLLLLIQVSKNALDGLDRSVSYPELLTLSAMNVILIAVSWWLFPFLWKS
jgi:heme exporter protein B